jgi:diaminopimelate epimerase
MTIEFYKYHGTGNDFVLLDNRDGKYYNLSQKNIVHLCHRRFGIGADGLMLLQNHAQYDFEMVYYNSDGNTSSMCGNGGRCISVFARDLGIVQTEASFVAIDGAHKSKIDDNDVELQMQDTIGITSYNQDFVLNTGSPHYVQFRDEVSTIDVRPQGAAIRNSQDFVKEGINVNFVKVRSDKTLQVVTYERGVEDETYSCGTGVVACALVQIRDNIGSNYVRISTKGGTLLVKCINHGKHKFTDVWLCGPATFVYKGTVSI